MLGNSFHKARRLAVEGLKSNVLLYTACLRLETVPHKAFTEDVSLVRRLVVHRHCEELRDILHACLHLGEVQSKELLHKRRHYRSIIELNLLRHVWELLPQRHLAATSRCYLVVRREHHHALLAPNDEINNSCDQFPFVPLFMSEVQSYHIYDLIHEPHTMVGLPREES